MVCPGQTGPPCGTLLRYSLHDVVKKKEVICDLPARGFFRRTSRRRRRKVPGAAANHWKRWGAKPEAEAPEGEPMRALLARCSFGCNWQTGGNAGTAKPEAKALLGEIRSPEALRSFGYRILCIRTIMQRKEESSV